MDCGLTDISQQKKNLNYKKLNYAQIMNYAAVFTLQKFLLCHNVQKKKSKIKMGDHNN